MIRVGLIAAAAVLVAGPASAEKVPATSPEAVQTLECAMWAAMIAGSVQDAETKTAFEYGMAYWVGEYEGMTGIHFDTQATVPFMLSVGNRLTEVQEHCAPRMVDMGERMQAWGTAIELAESPAD